MKLKLLLFIVVLFHSIVSFAGDPVVNPNAVSLINMGEVLSILFSLFGVVMLILIFSYGYKKISQINVTGQVEMKQLSTLQLGYKERISLIKVGDETFLIGIAPGNVNFLTKVNIDEFPSNNQRASCFSEKLMQAMNKGRRELEKGSQ